jgi:hypothetical protein
MKNGGLSMADSVAGGVARPCHFEWSSGNFERFGIACVDFTTRKRMPRPGSKSRRDTTASNAI